MQICIAPDVYGNAARKLYMDRAAAARLRSNCRNRNVYFWLGHDNRQQLRGRLRTTTKNPLAILIAPLEYLVRVHAVLARYTGNRCPRREHRFHNTTLLFCATMDALRRCRLRHTFNDFVHSVIVSPATASVQTALRRRLPNSQVVNLVFGAPNQTVPRSASVQ